jgi:arsenite methyltransferase
LREKFVSSGSGGSDLNVEKAVTERYSEGARSKEPALCCAVQYDKRFLAAIPEEVLERDYGCGDPSRYVREGEVVLDLGSGGGKICFIASQIVGSSGRVIGVDMNGEMLAMARRAAPQVARATGFNNVEFRRGRIQDLKLDLDRLDQWLEKNPVRSAGDLADLEASQDRLRAESPMIPDDSIDIVVSNCVLNLVKSEMKSQLIREIYRVLKGGGRIAISDIVSDAVVPEKLRNDPELWSGCISGAFEEQEMLRELESAGFHGIEISAWTEEPFSVVEGIEFRSVTYTAHKHVERPAMEESSAGAEVPVIYKGPWKSVEDDAGNVLRRGERTVVSADARATLGSSPYADQTISLSSSDAKTGCCGSGEASASTRAESRSSGKDSGSKAESDSSSGEPSACC